MTMTRKFKSDASEAIHSSAVMLHKVGAIDKATMRDFDETCLAVEEKTRPCPSCGGIMRRGVQEETVIYQGESLTYLQPGWHCENGDDGVLEGSDNDHADAALRKVMAR